MQLLVVSREKKPFISSSASHSPFYIIFFSIFHFLRNFKHIDIVWTKPSLVLSLKSSTDYRMFGLPQNAFEIKNNSISCVVLYRRCVFIYLLCAIRVGCVQRIFEFAKKKQNSIRLNSFNNILSNASCTIWMLKMRFLVTIEFFRDMKVNCSVTSNIFRTFLRTMSFVAHRYTFIIIIVKNLS